MENSRILELAAVINRSVKAVHESLVKETFPFPSFEANASGSLPEGLLENQDAVLDATAELHDLFLGPLNLLFRHGGHNNMLCLQAITRFDIAKKFTVGEQVSYAHLSKSTGLNEQLLRRLLRHAMMMRVFSEPTKGLVAHTAASNLLAEPCMHDWMKTGREEMWPAATRWRSGRLHQEVNEIGYALANDTGNSIYQSIGSDPRRGAQFANAMKAYTSRSGFEVSYIINNYKWDGLVKCLCTDTSLSQTGVEARHSGRDPGYMLTRAWNDGAVERKGLQRDQDEWKLLFQEADPRFDFIGVEEPRGSALAIIEARWNYFQSSS
ncbi:hypothetical protein HO133_008190 [Letharia lupina]|uniref:Uncharacterized protein n=1 Tax=Letharia lupina TaxID=560253 RepID=A0A8H6CRR8_9LECA|nr:uncharacterized protein HO133_008190 [Letharia lupina]KAF6228460.1 hypothetical protein HO133_008190 [Letharia lupina]